MRLKNMINFLQINFGTTQTAVNMEIVIHRWNRCEVKCSLKKDSNL